MKPASSPHRAPLRTPRHAALGLALLAGCSGRSCAPSPPAAPPPAASHAPAAPSAGASAAARRAGRREALRVPRARGAVSANGELDEEDWKRAARTDAFLERAGGSAAQPHSEAKLLWDDRFLYLALYATDRDIRATVATHDGAVWVDDSFALRFVPEGDRTTRLALDVSAAGVLTDVRETDDGGRDPGWESGAIAAIDRAGTPNDPRDDDEEWAVELAIPLASLELRPAPGARAALRISRCDMVDDERLCGAWGEGDAGRAVGVIELAE
jgi:hypothetical protein